MRDLSRALGDGVASSSRIHDAFTKPRLPAWGLVEVLVEHLASKAPGIGVSAEVKRFHGLWDAAAVAEISSPGGGEEQPARDSAQDELEDLPQGHVLRRLLEDYRAGRLSLTDLDDMLRMNAVTELLGNVDQSVLRLDEVAEQADRATEDGKLNSEMVSTFASEQIDRLAREMENLSRRSVDLLEENQDWLLSLTRCITHSLDAISTSVDHGVWGNVPASPYLKEQSYALGRGVQIRRLFLVDTTGEINNELTALCTNHRAVGLDARLAALSELPPWAQLRLECDFIVFDRELSYEIGRDPEDAKITLNAQRAHVDHRMWQFARLWEATTNLPHRGIPD
ncbi:hypothetical protein OG604_50760 [Streptomyces sp. NBC_01231]|nr:hypothetical protein OG604_00105 [Streptomyces sp. NBC_01231]WSQ15303.1 hypothetical protein OG604_50760 [Streptomyces sp. NBC_01231]